MHRPFRIVRALPVPRIAVLGRAVLFEGDSAEVLKTQESDSVDAIVTDPPYALISTLKRFANSPRTEASMPTAGPYARASRGFMGEKWDNGDVAHTATFWAECWRVLKPGGFVLAFGGTRTYHRLATAIEDAGFEIRDMVQWLYGSGFPKSHNHGGGRGTALKPACEPICMARKPLSEKTIAANLVRWGTGVINIDGCRVAVNPVADASQLRTMARGQRTEDTSGQTWGLSKAGGDVPQVVRPDGRWPANVVTDGSDEVVALFPSAPGQIARSREDGAPQGNAIYGAMTHGGPVHIPRVGESKSAARFFYCAKATKKDRAGSKHPTVKPVALIRYFCRMVTPPGGTVLDPFAGSGTTGEACHLEGFGVIMIEREARFIADIRARYAGLKVELAIGAAS